MRAPSQTQRISATNLARASVGVSAPGAVATPAGWVPSLIAAPPASLRRDPRGSADLERRPAVRPPGREAGADAEVEDADDDQHEEGGERRVDAVVEDDLPHLVGVLRRRQHLALGERGREPVRVRQEADARVGVEDLLDRKSTRLN